MNSPLTDEEQLNIMRGQLSRLDSIVDKVAWFQIGFADDPMFTEKNRKIIKDELVSSLPKNAHA